MRPAPLSTSASRRRPIAATLPALEPTGDLPESPGAFLRLVNDGDTANVVFLGEPFPHEICWVRGLFLPADDSLRAAGHKPSMRWLHTVALLESRKVLLFDQGVTFYKEVVRMGLGGPLDQRAFELRRRGAARDKRTRYSLTPLRVLTEDERKEFAALPRHDLKRLVAPSPGDPDGATRLACLGGGYFDPLALPSRQGPIFDFD